MLRIPQTWTLGLRDPDAPDCCGRCGGLRLRGRLPADILTLYTLCLCDRPEPAMRPPVLVVDAGCCRAASPGR
jgi:hypothetical protein